MQDTGIEWTNDTINPWWGCARVPNPAGPSECDRCYAASLSGAFGGPRWGATTDRRLQIETALRGVARSVRTAQRDGARRRVFVASMADVFEGREDLAAPRAEFLEALRAYPGASEWLQVQLLTKRPHVMLDYGLTRGWERWWWAGTTCGHAGSLPRVAELLRVPAAVRFVSVEPLLGPVDLRAHLPGLRWVIVGGESGAGARPMHPDWVRRVRDDCDAAGVAFFFKQWGDWAPEPGDGKLFTFPDGTRMWRVGKKLAGKTLDGRVHDAFPE